MAITTEQLQERANYLGGSDAAGILGLSKWKTPLQIFMSKVHPNPDNSETRIGGKSEPAYWGNKLEDVVAETFAEEEGKKVYRVNETLIHPQYDFIRANIDRRVVGEDAILECKTCSAYKAKDWEGEEIPAEYILQVMHYLAVTGKDKAYLAVLIGGQKYISKEVLRDEELIKQIVDAEVTFWNEFILKKQPPMVTGADSDSRLLDRLYPEANINTSITLSDDRETMLDKREALDQEIKKKEFELNEIENLIKEEMKDSESALAGKYLLTWKNQHKISLDTKALKEKLPDIYLQFQKDSQYRVFRVKVKKEEK